MARDGKKKLVITLVGLQEDAGPVHHIVWAHSAEEAIQADLGFDPTRYEIGLIRTAAEFRKAYPRG